MYKLKVIEEILRRFLEPRKRIQVIAGPRQVGKTFESFIKYHLMTCERKELLGATAHTVDILRKQKKSADIHDSVRRDYGKIAREEFEGSVLSGNNGSKEISSSVGYTQEELALAPEGANMGLGCGNPHRKAEISQGEVVLDLGSGSGLDCFIAGKKVGRRGRVIGVDMTPEMISKARARARGTLRGDAPC